jgi:CII-binding regulator of phage lambda lysogenization HflD
MDTLSCIKNLVNLSSNNNINIYDKNKKIKTKDKIINECLKEKKKELKDISKVLLNLSKLSQFDNVKDVYNNYENKINNIDKIISIVNTEEENIYYTEKYIEKYGN